MRNVDINAIQVSKVSAYEEFRDKLLTGELKPGQFVTQSELAGLAGVSIAAAREAIQKLEHELLLKVHPKRGIQIAEVTLEFIRNAFDLRKILECDAVRQYSDLSARHEATRMLADTVDVLEQVRSDTSLEVLDTAVDVDWRLHDEIISRLGNRLLSEVYQINAVRIRLIKTNNRLTPDRVVGALTEHLAILEFCVAGDAEGAAKSMTSHIETAMQRAIDGV